MNTKEARKAAHAVEMKNRRRAMKIKVKVWRREGLWFFGKAPDFSQATTWRFSAFTNQQALCWLDEFKHECDGLKDVCEEPD